LVLGFPQSAGSLPFIAGIALIVYAEFFDRD
jgi:hypothetical protein